MAAVINTTLTITVGSFLGTHLTAFDTVDHGRVRVPLETSRADNSLWRERDGSDGFGSRREPSLCGHHIQPPHLSLELPSSDLT